MAQNIPTGTMNHESSAARYRTIRCGNDACESDGVLAVLKVTPHISLN